MKKRWVLGAVFLSVAVAGATTPTQAQARSKKPKSEISGSVASGGRVKVSVHGVHKSTRTDKTGFFILKGKKLSGLRTITFKKGSQTAALTVNVPAGANVSLQSVTLNSDGSASPDEVDIEVTGTLSAVDCASTPNSFTIVPSEGGSPVVMSFDPATTHIVDDATSTTITDCATLAGFVNSQAQAEGTQNSSGGIDAARLELNPQSDQGEKETEFSGVVQSENCPNSIVVQRSDGMLVIVNLSSSTQITIDGQESDSSGTCTDIPANAMVEVTGAPQSDGSVNATEITVEQQNFESSGTINSTSCSSNPPSLSFTPDGSQNNVTVTIGPTTDIQVGGNESATCGDLSAGAAKIEGVLQTDGSVAATDIEQGQSSGDGSGGD